MKIVNKLMSIETKSEQKFEIKNKKNEDVHECAYGRNVPVSNMFCERHTNIMKYFRRVNDDEKYKSCSTFKEIKIIPRSWDYLVYIMDKYEINKEDNVDIFLPGGSVEEGDIKNEDYIELVSDGKKYYYQPEKKQLNTKNLKIILPAYCIKKPYMFRIDTKTYYCEDCYEKIGKNDYPHISLF